jgi:hypothetical protein
MTVTITKPAINIREQLTELKATQGYEERQFHFDNLVTNGTFDTDTTGWTVNSVGTSSFTASGGEAYLDRGDQSSVVVYQTFSTVAGEKYVVFMEKTAHFSKVNIGTGINSNVLYDGSNDGNDVLATFTATGTTTYITIVNNQVSVAQIDNISVYTSDGTDAAFTMPKGWKPLHVYDDGVLQREGSAEDYEVTYDGFNYYVKPTVANPGARNTVIGVRA